MFINGEWRGAGPTFPSINPATTKPIAQVPLATPAHVAQAVEAARAALPAWRALGTPNRANMLTGALERLREAYGDEGAPTPLKNLITQEVGKRLPEADIEVTESADMLEYFIGSAQSLLGREVLALDKALWPTKSSTVMYEPVGVVAVIKPWNYPLELPMWSIAPALIAGNTVVFKPAEDASLVGAELTRLIADFVPDGVLNLVSGPADVGRMLVEADIDMVSFTGSTAVGHEITAWCGAHMRRYTMELGGNDAAIVMPDADIELSANGLTWGCFCNSGQVCVRPKRIFVHQTVAQDLVSAVVEKTHALRRGVDFGPLINAMQLTTVEEQIEDARISGARVLCGGTRFTDGGYYYAPTILVDVTPSMRVMREECFGPVMPIVTFESTEEALGLANSGVYGLGASIWTADVAGGSQLAEALDCGMVWVNDVNVAFPQAPWGGRKSSGTGTELGKWGLHEYVTPKHINIDTDKATRRAWWYPY
ncbi:MAG TPA: aldehyde dehydrogenase family protein [Solirubrobacteraceae bacterium]|nr:aldehyde dehydrogenase family protein [Solirubrobacteraceae bacterium]